MTLYEMANALIKGGLAKDRGFVQDLRDELYRTKGDESEVTQQDVRRLNSLYRMFFQGGDDATKRIVKTIKRRKSQ